MNIGDTILEYRITGHLGDSELEDYYAAQHIYFDTPAHVRVLKPQHVSDGYASLRYVVTQVQAMRELGLEENIHFYVVDKGGVCCLIRNLESTYPEPDGKYDYSAPPPNEGVLAAYHEQVQLLGRASLPASVLAAIGCLGWTIYLTLDGIRFLGVVLFLLGLGFCCIGVASVGVLEQRRWGLRLASVGYFTVFGVSPLIFLVGKEWGKDIVGARMAEHRETMFAVSMVLLMVPTIAGLVVLYSKKAKYYFR